MLDKYSNVQKERSVIVIGAGVSGISAAFHLRQHGIQNVAVLEGSERLVQQC